MRLISTTNKLIHMEKTTAERDNLRYTKIPLSNGSQIPALGFGTLIPNPIDTIRATAVALEAGFRQLDSSERYRNEKEVGEAMQDVFKEGKIKREDVFIATKLWNNNHVFSLNLDRKSTRLNSSHITRSRMPSSA